MTSKPRPIETLRVLPGEGLRAADEVGAVPLDDDRDLAAHQSALHQGPQPRERLLGGEVQDTLVLTSQDGFARRPGFREQGRGLRDLRDVGAIELEARVAQGLAHRGAPAGR